MPIKKDYGEEPVRGELGLMLLLVVCGIIGLLIWGGLFLSIRWIVSAAWTATIEKPAAASSARSAPAQSAAPTAWP